MGMLLTKVSFSDTPPSVEELVHKLSKITGMKVHIEVVDEGKPASTSATSVKLRPRDLQIHFTNPTDNFNHSIWCGWANHGEFHIHEPADVLNRCPNYLLYALIAALTDLGGVSEMNDKLPSYARSSFEEWKKLNRGARPAKWKIAAASIGTLIYFCWLTVAMLFALLISMILIPFCWLNIRKEFRGLRQPRS